MRAKKYYENAMKRYANFNNDLTENDKRFCAVVEAIALDTKDIVSEAVRIAVAVPTWNFCMAALVGMDVYRGIKDATLASYEEYIKENGTRI